MGLTKLRELILLEIPEIWKAVQKEYQRSRPVRNIVKANAVDVGIVVLYHHEYPFYECRPVAYRAGAGGRRSTDIIAGTGINSAIPSNFRNNWQLLGLILRLFSQLGKDWVKMYGMWVTLSLLYPKITLYFGYLLAQFRQFVLYYVPHNFIRNNVIPVCQDIPKSNNSLIITYSSDYSRINFLEPIESFPNNFKLSFYG